MFFNPWEHLIVLPTNFAPFVYQLTDEEMKRYGIIDIKHVGAVLDIKFCKKEGTLMVEKLQAYRAELEAKKAELINIAINVEPEVEAYRNKLIADAEAKKAAEIAKYESDINCIGNIIAREEELAAEQATVVVETPITE